MDTNSNKKTEEILLQTMREHKREEIPPNDTVKNNLDKALGSKRHHNSVFARRIPLYQSAAVAVIFFILGLGLSFTRPATPPQIVHTITKVIKYVDRPVVTEVVKYVDRPVAEIRYIEQPAIYETCLAQNVTNENKGVSLQEDTILQKMLVTIY
jgi:hypothetical protein